MHTPERLMSGGNGLETVVADDDAVFVVLVGYDQRLRLCLDRSCTDSPTSC
jgi:hypothetical protein